MTALAPLVVPVAVQREDLDPRRGECLVCYVDRLLARADCTGSLELARWWRDVAAPRASGLEARLRSLGAGCDCELLSIVYESLPTLVGRRAGPWDRPACGTVRRGSAQPCSRWGLRVRWSASTPGGAQVCGPSAAGRRKTVPGA